MKFKAPRPLTMCLDCRDKLAGSRGVCPACYNRQAKAIKAGAATDAALVARGQRAAKRRGWV